ncbi:MAG: hypothetical protein LBU87_03795, partial [Lactobacillales bacterium]|nr:hypothetical protein [Lactobacillales bacterium]
FLLFNNADNINFKGNTKTIIYDTLDDIMVTSEDGLFVIQPDRTITAVKNAVVTQTEKTLTADKIILYYTEDKENRIEKIEAFGHVKAWTPDEEITGERGDYNPKTGLITMTDNVTLTQGVNTMSGDRAFMNMQTGVSTLSEKPNKNPDDIKKRVRGSLIPAQLK